MSKGQKSFFKPKNRLKSRFGFRKSASFSSLFNGEKEIRRTSNKKVDKSFEKSRSPISNTFIKKKGRIGLRNSSKKNLNIYSDIGRPFDNIQKKLNINIDTESIQQKLYDYENNEITNRINNLPENMNILKRGSLKKGKALNFGYNLKKLSLNPLRHNFIKISN